MTTDEQFLTNQRRPTYELGEPSLRVVDLFSGCGGLSLGLAEAAHSAGRALDIALAVEFEAAIAKVYASNFPKARVEECDVAEIFDGELGAKLTPVEIMWRDRIGPVDILQGGPPCQGHSDLNNHTRRDDPRNVYYERMARAAEVLRPSAVIIENVPTVRHARGAVVDRAIRTLEDADYTVADRVISFLEMGVPQRRKRHTVLATRGLAVDPTVVLDQIGLGTMRDLRWAIGDLEQLPDPIGLDVPSRITPANVQRINWLFEQDAYDLVNSERPECHQGNHSYVSMYGRLRWDEPAQTITSGYGSMGQGRYVHPSQGRTLTPHEAARLQFFPDWFDFTAGGTVMKRGAWATMIANAVPPKLTMELGKRLIPYL